MKVQYFKARRSTNGINANQRVWIRQAFANHLYIWHKWRGCGRYVSGICSRFAPHVGEIKEIDVPDEFAKRITKE